MGGSTAKIAALVLATAIVAAIGIKLVSRAEAKSAEPAGATDVAETGQVKIERAMSAGPPKIARSAKIIDKDAQGHTVILREGTNGCRLAKRGVIPAFRVGTSLRFCPAAIAQWLRERGG